MRLFHIMAVRRLPRRMHCRKTPLMPRFTWSNLKVPLELAQRLDKLLPSAAVGMAKRGFHTGDPFSCTRGSCLCGSGISAGAANKILPPANTHITGRRESTPCRAFPRSEKAADLAHGEPCGAFEHPDGPGEALLMGCVCAGGHRSVEAVSTRRNTAAMRWPSAGRTWQYPCFNMARPTSVVCAGDAPVPFSANHSLFPSADTVAHFKRGGPCNASNGLP